MATQPPTVLPGEVGAAMPGAAAVVAAVRMGVSQGDLVGPVDQPVPMEAAVEPEETMAMPIWGLDLMVVQPVAQEAEATAVR